MANLGANGAAWSPSGFWDGTKFTFISSGETDTITYGGSVGTGDVVSFDIVLISNEFEYPIVRVFQGATELDSFGGFVPLPASYTSPAFTSGAGAVSIVVEAQFGTYAHEFTLTPVGASVPCFWTDLVGTQQDCEPA